MSVRVRVKPEVSPEERRELARQVVNLFFAAERDGQSHPGQKFADIFVSMLDELELNTKVKLAEHVSRSTDVSQELIRKMSTAEVVVASPVLENSPLLSEDDLLNAVQNTTTEHRLAVSRRESGLSSKVTDSLISFGETPVLRSVTDNDNAVISQEGFETLVASAEADDELLSHLAARYDLPASCAQSIVPRLTPASRAKLAALTAGGESVLEMLVARAKSEEAGRRLSARQQRVQAQRLVKEIETRSRKLDEVIVMLASQKQSHALHAVIATCSRLPEGKVASAMIEKKGELLALLCRALDLKAESYLACDALRREKLRQAAGDPETLRTAYAVLDLEETRRALRVANVIMRVA